MVIRTSKSIRSSSDTSARWAIRTPANGSTACPTRRSPCLVLRRSQMTLVVVHEAHDGIVSHVPLRASVAQTRVCARGPEASSPSGHGMARYCPRTHVSTWASATDTAASDARASRTAVQLGRRRFQTVGRCTPGWPASIAKVAAVVTPVWRSVTSSIMRSRALQRAAVTSNTT